jgi:hypothetical protein
MKSKYEKAHSNITHLLDNGECFFSIMSGLGYTYTQTSVVIPFASQARPDIVHSYNAGRIYSNPLDLLLFQTGLALSIQRPPKKCNKND